MANALYYGDNLAVLRDSIASASVDLIYLDPPFNSQANYNVLFKGPSGKGADAQIEAFEDTWHWGEESERAFAEVLDSSHTQAAELLRAMRGFLGDNDVMAYLAMMAVRLIELHRVLKPTGSLYLHCDPTASHYLKITLDSIFGKNSFISEIVWRRTNARGTSGKWPRMHDSILQFSKSPEFPFHQLKIKADENKMPHTLVPGPGGLKYQSYELTAPGATIEGDSGKPWRGFDPNRYGRHWANSHVQMDLWDDQGLIHWPPNSGFPRRRGAEPFDPESRMITVGDVWTDIDRLNQTARERLGYPTQKPVALLERIIAASSNEGDLVLDPFCGCGTTIHAAQKLGRQWIGIDITHLAISLIERRLKDAFPGVGFEVHGTPKDLASAIDLARRDKYQFQWWAVSLVEARPYGGRKKGADRGIDGILFFRSDKEKTEKALISVKGGDNVGVGMVRELIAVVEREKAAIGVLISLALPTRAMESEAIAAGLFETPFEKVPKIQIITLAELFQGKRPRIPRPDTAATFRTAARESTETQARLL
jgi:DNA modification methylase